MRGKKGKKPTKDFSCLESVSVSCAVGIIVMNEDF